MEQKIVINWTHLGRRVHVFISNQSYQMDNDWEKWTISLDMLPGIYVYRFLVDFSDVHDTTQPFVNISSQPYNVLCVGPEFSTEMVLQFYHVLNSLALKECCEEVDDYLNNKFPIDLFAPAHADKKYYKYKCCCYGTLLHWACIYNRKKNSDSFGF